MNTYQPIFIGPPGADNAYAIRTLFWRAGTGFRQIRAKCCATQPPSASRESVSTQGESARLPVS